MLVESAQEGTSQDRCLWAGVAENTPGFHRGGGREDLGEDCFEREDSGLESIQQALFKNMHVTTCN